MGSQYYGNLLLLCKLSDFSNNNNTRDLTNFRENLSNVMEKTKKNDFPPELVADTKKFQDSLTTLNKLLDTYESVPLQDLVEQNNLDSVSKAKLDCLSAFALNSLVWMWLRTKGQNPKETGVKAELDRVKACMLRLKEVQDKSKRNPVDAQAAKRLVKGSLWTPKDSNKRSSSGNSSGSKKAKK